MAKTDEPFKLLVMAGKEQFVTWVLGKQVQSVRDLSKELFKKTDPIRPDLLFEVTMDDGSKTILHIEFQGESSEPPMPLRELWYIALAVEEYPNMSIMSVVFYVGEKAGINDTGHHRVLHPNGSVTVEWHYTVIRLAAMNAEEIIQADIVELLPLVGQTHMEHPEQILPQVVSRLEQIADVGKRHTFFKILVNLTTEQKGWIVLKSLIEITEMYDTPFVQEEREKGYNRGLVAGVEKGELNMLRANILDALRFRLNMHDTELKKVELVLMGITSRSELSSLFEAAFQVESFAEFWAKLGS